MKAISETNRVLEIALLIIFQRIPYSHYMITIRRMTFFVILVCIFLSPVNAAETDGKDKTIIPIFGGYCFSVSPMVGALYGISEEIFYDSKNSNRYLSELLWDLKPLYYAGFVLDFAPKDFFGRHGLIAAASAKIGLPLETGIIEDRDWLDYSDNVTHYSRHDAYARFAVLADASLGFSWRLSDFLSLGLYGEFSYMHFSWSAKNGYAQYPGNNYVFKGEVMKYTQNWYILAPGISIKGKLGRFFSVEGNFCYSPLIYCEARDDHLLEEKDITYKDYLYYGHYFNGNGILTFSPRHNIDLCLSLAYRYITGPRGDSYINDRTLPEFFGTGYRKYSDIAGAGYKAIDLSLAVKFYIFGAKK